MEASVYELLNTVICKDDLRNITCKLLDEDKVDDKNAELASRKGVVEVVKKYLEEGKDVNKLLYSTASGQQGKTCLLANSIGGGHFEDKYRRTCLQKALITENKEIVELLLSYGDWMDKLTAAVYNGDVDAVDSLIKNKASNVTINAQQKV